MAKPTLTERQIQHIGAEVDRKFYYRKEFYSEVAAFLKDSDGAAKRWFERLKPGREIRANRMEAIIKTLDISLNRFEEDVLRQPGFCLHFYGQGFVNALCNNNCDPSGNAIHIAASTTIEDGSPLVEKRHVADLDSSLFVKFFGPSIMVPKNHVQIVFPKRKLKMRPNKSNEPPFEHGDCTFSGKNGKTLHNVHPEGVSGYLCFEDVRAAAHIANFVRKKCTEMDVWIRHDNSAFDAKDTHCTFVFGLGFTAATRWTEDEFMPKLFSTYCDVARDGKYLTDHFLLKFMPTGASTSSKPSLRKIPLRDGHDVALIIRAVRKSPEGVVSQPWFICAGRTATGTSVAAHFLSTRWLELAELFRSHQKDFNHDSLAVVVSHRLGNSAEYGANSPLLIENTANILYWDERSSQKCISWG